MQRLPGRPEDSATCPRPRGRSETVLEALNRAHARYLVVGGVAVVLYDLVVEEPFDFDQVYARALRVPLERIKATVVALDDLLALKRGAGSPLDQQDVAALEALRTESEPGPQEEGNDQL